MLATALRYWIIETIFLMTMIVLTIRKAVEAWSGGPTVGSVGWTALAVATATLLVFSVRAHRLERARITLEEGLKK